MQVINRGLLKLAGSRWRGEQGSQISQFQLEEAQAELERHLQIKQERRS